MAKKNLNWFFSLLPWDVQTVQTVQSPNMFQNVAHRPTVYKTRIFPNVNDAVKDKDIFPMDIETMDLLLNVAVVGSQLFEEYFSHKKNYPDKISQKAWPKNRGG